MSLAKIKRLGSPLFKKRLVKKKNYYLVSLCLCGSKQRRKQNEKVNYNLCSSNNDFGS